ncbi:hypothetical protein FRB94_006970 [Tulasnella sp. JGI-2019a]|nr:hypothetical protein FRB94_006970 [Tulasnella sp. JGI-2019a]KAG9012036.1 hypothetical protein FRB93_002179 [Tulasnella sp. JGI-2019a]KAG9038888.1 hypothetical protein FRB95_013566 [Tulasnella sp. JGI-2019a]
MAIEAFHRPGQKTFGPWGNHTSSLDWCEDNYTHLTFIAEFWNTTSNIPFIMLGIFGVLSTYGLPSRTRYALAHSFIAIIGTGSFIFHGTLLWHAQVILDELPMLWSAAISLYLTSVGGAVDGSLKLKMLITAIPIGFSWLYLCFPHPLLHQVAFAGMQVVSVLQGVRLFESLPSATAEQRRMVSACKYHFFVGAGVFLLGFAIWNVDNLFCVQLTAFRSKHGEIAGALTQGHAWWHLLTGLGGSRLFSALTFLTLAAREPDAFEFATYFGHPYVIRKGVDPMRKLKVQLNHVPVGGEKGPLEINE